jgi:propionyl-CoA synthetase
MGIEPLPIKRGSPTVAVPGYDVRVLDDEGRELPAGETGHITLKLPLPPGCLRSLWENDEGYERAYLKRFPGYYQTADAGHIDEDGYLWIMARTDDIINVAGHRLSTGAMEEVLAAHPEVAECAVTGVADPIKGQVPVGFVVLNAGVSRSEPELEAELVSLVREAIGPVAAFKQALVVDRLPKTRSGKVLRGIMRRIADGEPYRTPPTIDDPAILDEIRAALEARGLAKSGR